MSPHVSLRTGGRITAIPRRLVLVVCVVALATLALNWESAGLRIGHAQSGLVAAYNFDEGAGSTAADSSGLGNNGVFSGATWAAAGKYGRALSFADRGDLVTIADHPSLDLANAFTLEAWVRPSASSNPRTVLIKEAPGDLAYALYSNHSAQRPVVWAGSGDAEFSAAGNNRLSTGVWTHLAATYNGSTLRFYVNGISVSARPMTGTLNSSSMALRIGGTTLADEWYRGLIDDVRIYNRALSAAEIQTDMVTPVGQADTTEPEITVTAPADGATISGSVTVSATTTDDVGVGGVQFYLDGAILGAEDTTAPYGVTWDTRTAANGTHTLTATGHDAADNTATSTVTVTVTNPPRLLILQPPGGATITGATVAISYSTQGELTEAEHAHFSLDGGPVQIDLSLDGAYQIANVTAGAHTLTGYLARADHSQIVGSEATPVTFTTAAPDTPPTVAVTAPAAGSTVAGLVTVRADAADDKAVAGVQFLVDNAAVGSEDTVAPYEIVWDSRTTTNGPHAVSARARDAAGNVTSSTVTVTVNNIPPRLVILQPPGGATITGTSVAITYSTQGDLAEAEHAHFSLDGGPVQIDLSLDGAYQIANVTAGAHTLTGYLARADHSQIVGSEATPVTFTTVAPDTPPTVAVTAPAAASTVAGNVIVRADATDDNAVAGVQFLLDGAALGSEDTAAPYEIVWDSRTTTNGPHAITARARDAADSTTSSTVTVTVNNIPPRLVILQPPGGATITGTTVAITYSAQGDLAEAEHAHFSLDGGPVQIDLSLDGAYQIANVTAGAHTLSGYLARADHSQIAGSEATPVTFTTAAPDTPPTVGVTAPAAGSTVVGLVTVGADAADDNAVAGVQFLLDGAPMSSEDPAAPYEIVWDSRTTTNGPHAISARARDAAGNTATSTVTVTVNNIPPRLVILQPPGGATIAGTTVAITYSTQGDLADAHHVHFALDGGSTLMDLSFDGAYQISNVASGAHTLTGYLARADHSRIVGSDATPVSFATFVLDTPPSVSVTAPVAGSTVVGNVTLRADAADNIAVVGVQFLLDGSAVGNEDTTAPYEITWDSRTTLNGAHAISARARDAAGNAGVSAAVDIEVANIAETGPALTGQWSAPISLPVVAIHQALLPSGQVLMWDAADFTSAPPILWNPQTGTFANMPATSTDLFCVGHAMLANGKLLTVGGDTRTTGLGVNDVNLFDPQTNSWTAMPKMASRRWYPTATTLSDGRVFVLSGYDDCYGPSCLVGRPEIYNPVTNAWTSLTSSNYVSPSYPFLFEMPDGRIIHAGSYEGTVDTRVLDLSTGAWSVLDSNPIDAGSAVMYAPGKIMKAGKWANSDPPYVAAHANTYVMDLSQPAPQWRTTAPMNFPRAYNMLTLLPDGTTLATAGSRSTDPGNGAQAVLEAEIWSPANETWTTMARMRNPRMYHGTSILLPDGRVIVAGSGRYGSPEQFNAEIFSPPYLFKGARPVITSVPAVIAPGQTFAVETPATDVAAVTMIRIGAMTHSFNSDQRFMSLPFTSEGGVLQVAAPANVHVMMPGYYMIFVVNEAGVPSVGAFVRVPATSEDVEPPAAPGNLSAQGGLGQATLTWTAASDNVAIAQYRVHRSTIAGFTPGDTNLVGTTSTTGFLDTGVAGIYYYRVVARDAAGNTGPASNEAAAAITADATAPSVAITAPASGASVSGVVTVSATALDNVGVAGVRFQLDGVALGAEDTSDPYSVSWNSATATAGVHQLTAIARDGAGNLTTSDPIPVTVVLAAPAGLVAALGFDEGAGTATSDASGLGNHGTLANTSWTPSGRFGSALMFNGTSSWVTVADRTSLDLTTGMTLSAWVRPTSVTSDFRTILLKELAPGLAYALYATDGASRPPSGYINTGGSDIAVVATSNLALNTWTHVAMTYDGTAMRIYVNGALIRTTNAPGAIRTSTGALRIGGNGVWGEYFAGTIDEVRVYNRALNASDIQADMTRAVTAPATP